MKKITCLTLILLALVNNAYAQGETANAKTLTASCNSCHGEDGIALVPGAANLAGQQVEYLVKEITLLQSGERIAPMMPTALLNGLTEQQISEIAKHYASLPQQLNEAKTINAAGENVRARCVSCHGMTGNTITSLWPNLRGQKADYLEAQLLAYKSGQREHPIMHVIANELSDQQIADVAEYYSQQ